MATSRTAGRNVRPWLGAAALGVALAWSLLAHAGVRPPLGPRDWALGAVAAAVLALAVHTLLFRVAGPRLALLASRTARRFLIVGALAGGALLIVLLPVRVRHLHTLEITATGQKNPAAAGNEVWLIAFTLPDQSQVPFAEISADPGWGPRLGMLCCYEHSPATLRWSGAVSNAHSFDSPGPQVWDASTRPAYRPSGNRSWYGTRGTAVLRFVTHPYSGMAQIAWNGHVQALDLYSPQRGERRVALPITPKDIARDRRTMFAAMSIDGLGLSVLILALASSATARRNRPALAVVRRSELVATAAMVVIVGAVFGALWQRGLGNLAYHVGHIELDVAVKGADVLPLHLDLANREVVDIPLNLYEHEVHCALQSDEDGHRVGLRGVVDDRTHLHGPDALELDGTGPIEQLPDTGTRPWSVMWMGSDCLRAFSWRWTYENALAHFYVPDGPAHVSLTIDGYAENIELRPNEDGWAYVPLRPRQRPPGLIRYSATLPPVRVSQLRVVPLPGTESCTVGHVTVHIPGVIDVTPPTPAGESNAEAPPELTLTGPLSYSRATALGQVRLIVFGVATGTLGLWAIWRLRGKGRRQDVFRRPCARWEWLVPLAAAGAGLWLQSGLCGAYSRDSMDYISQAITLVETGTLDPALNAHPPGYCLLLAATMFCGGAGVAIWAVHSALLVVGVVAAWHLGRQMGGRIGGALLAIFVGTNPLLLIGSRVLLPDFPLAIACLVWLVVALKWATSKAHWSWLWAAVAAMLWALPMAIKPNAVTLAGIGLIVPYLQEGPIKHRAAGALCFLGVALCVYSIPGIRGETADMVSWGRFWPILQNRFVAFDSREFRPLREHFLASRISVAPHLRPPDFYNRIFTDSRREETKAALAATTAASIRRHPHLVRGVVCRCLRRAYIAPWRVPFYHWPKRYRTADDYATYNEAFATRVRADHRLHPATARFFDMLHTRHPEGTLSWWIFPELHRVSRQWRLVPLTALGLVGLAHAVYRRRGLLVLPAAMNLLLVLPLCAIFVSYDRYFLPAEALLALQAAVGVRALVNIVRRAIRWA